MTELHNIISQSTKEFDNIPLCMHFKENRLHGKIEMIYVDGVMTELDALTKHRFDFKKAELSKVNGVVSTK